MLKGEKRRLHDLSTQLGIASHELARLVDSAESWTIEGLRRELDRWQQELESATNSDGEHYSADTIKSHIGHSAQFIRWLAGEWHPTGPRSRA